ncbi:MAG TPA: response regulator transcription factor [Firmicutes bacterium]|nr:response regulator transcription factor [Bacillota bacterium]
MPDKILIVEDDESISELIAYNLQQAGFSVLTAFDGETGLALALKEEPDLVLLDIMLPGIDGWEVCSQLRQSSQVPILFLTAKDAEFDRVRGLELGADDYVTKPFSPRELVARVKAILRRASRSAEIEQMTIGRVTVDFRSHLVTLDGQPLNLTPMEYQLLRILAMNPGRVFSREELLTEVWGEEFFGDQRTVDVHISHLREKLGEASHLIQTARGFGYKLRE